MTSTVMTSEDAEKLGTALKDLKGQVLKRANSINNQAKDLIGQSRDLFHQKPLYFVGGALFLGLTVGYMMSGSRSRRSN